MLSDAAAATTQIFQVDLNQIPRVLLVDDDELVLERLATLIRATGFEVETAADGTTALQVLQSRFAPLQEADQALYTSKANGRNRVTRAR